MKLNDVELLIQKFTPKLFSFSMALVPENLQAQQIVVDSIGKLMINNQDIFVNNPVESFSLVDTEVEKKIKVKLLKYIFELGFKRYSQLASSLKSFRGKEVAFGSLETKDKAILFLKHRFGLGIDEISKIVDEPRVIVISRLNLVRDKLMRDTGDEVGWQF